MDVWAAEVAVTSGLDSVIPPGLEQISLVGLLLLIAVAFIRDWVISSTRHEKELATERKVSEVWEQNATSALALLKELTNAFDPVLKGNEALLKAVSEIQEEQRRYRDERGTR
jgi:hypothetical protein